MTSLRRASKIEQNIREHAKLMAAIEAEGISREKASELALALMKAQDKLR